MSSFYGGRRGASFEIVKRYTSLEEMYSDIKKIDYNKYVIVEEGNKIYRRVLNDLGYEFIMSVDPKDISTSLASSLNLVNFSDVESLKTNPSYSIGVAEITSGNESTIKYNSVITENGNTLMGFSFPAYNFDFELKEDGEETGIKRIDDQTNPFYSKWQLSIKNLIGRSFSNLRLVSSNDVTVPVYSSSDYITPVTLPQNVFVLLYDIQEEEKKTIYFGSFDTINEVELSDLGLLTIKTLNKQLNYQIMDIKNITFTDGVLSFIYKDNSSKNFNINYPKSIALDDDYSLSVTYANNEKEKISDPINYILDTKIENNHLFIKFSDKLYKESQQDEDGYIDYGSVKADSGLLIGKNYSIEEISSTFSIPTTIEFLNTEYPNGLTGDGLEGKIITVGNYDDNKAFFAFDYEDKTWYFLQADVSESSVSNLVSVYSDENYLLAEELPNGGFWFIEEE